MKDLGRRGENTGARVCREARKDLPQFLQLARTEMLRAEAEGHTHAGDAVLGSRGGSANCWSVTA